MYNINIIYYKNYIYIQCLKYSGLKKIPKTKKDKTKKMNKTQLILMKINGLKNEILKLACVKQIPSLCCVISQRRGS